MESSFLCSSLEDLRTQPPDVLVVGSGVAGTAVAEQLYLNHPERTIVILERGSPMLPIHLNDLLLQGRNPSIVGTSCGTRETFISSTLSQLWVGDFNPGGKLLLAIGGRSTIAGGHLCRFSPDDYTLWPDGQWPISSSDLNPFYAVAEQRRRVSIGSCDSVVQRCLLGELVAFNPHLPPCGLDKSLNLNANFNKGTHSSARVLYSLLLDDFIESKRRGRKRRLLVVPNCYVTHLEHSDTHVTGLVCVNTQCPTSPAVTLKAKTYVLAASAIESSRLVLHSGLDAERPATGRYLSEHLYLRGEAEIPAPSEELPGQFVHIIVPPQGRTQTERFQIELKGQSEGDSTRLRLTAIGALEPQFQNCVTLSSKRDAYGIRKAHTRLSYSENDSARLKRMQETMDQIVERVSGKWSKPAQLFRKGRSHHESGTLRMGNGDVQDSVTDKFGRVLGMENLWAADNALFPSVGIANPMLTIVSLAYRAADAMCQYQHCCEQALTSYKNQSTSLI